MAGDLHVHTTYSHDSYGGPEDDNTGADGFFTFGWGVGDEGLLAATRGLDYVAITDHNDIRSQADFDEIRSYGVIPIPSYENSLAGHAQMHGATRLYDNGSGSLADVERVASELRAAGGVFQINHPSDREWLTRYGYGFVPDAVEIWNIGVWAYEPPAPATNNHEFPLEFYDEFLKAGHHIAATGGSDSHWRSTTAAQGVGQPTTWICAEEDSVNGLLEGMRAGRTTISHQPPAYGGPFAELTADADGDGEFESMLGDAVDPGTSVRASVSGAPGATLRLVTDVGSQEVLVDGAEFHHDFALDTGATFARAEVFYEDAQETRQQLQAVCDGLEQLTAYFGEDEVAYCDVRLAMVAMTSPIYFSASSFDPATSLVYDGDTGGRVGSTATFAARLTGSNGPIQGAPIAFEYRGDTYSADTDVTGRASASVRLVGPLGDYEVVSLFVGNDTYRPSEDRDAFTVEGGSRP